MAGPCPVVHAGQDAPHALCHLLEALCALLEALRTLPEPGLAEPRSGRTTRTSRGGLVTHLRALAWLADVNDPSPPNRHKALVKVDW